MRKINNVELAIQNHRSIKVNVRNITWDTGDYEEYDDDGNIINEEEWNLPRNINDMEITLYDVDPNTLFKDLDEGDIEEAIFSGLEEEYGFCIEMMEWDLVKYETVKHETKDYWYVWNLEENREICDEDGNPYHFDSLDEANAYIENLQELMNEK